MDEKHLSHFRRRAAAISTVEGLERFWVEDIGDHFRRHPEVISILRERKLEILGNKEGSNVDKGAPGA